MKTIIEWLSELPDGYRERALSNMDKEDQDRIEPSMARALACAFLWSETQERAAFWEQVRDHYVFGTSLPPLP